MRKYATKKIATRRPIMLGYQAAGSAPIVRGRPVENPETVATAIRIGNPVSWRQALAASRESGGWFAECSDPEILRVQKLLAETEGLFCEPASAISLAGLLKDLELGKVGEGSTIVCTLTGHGLKDPDTAIAQSPKPLTVEAELAAIERVIRERRPR
jgi:threonine synthase